MKKILLLNITAFFLIGCDATYLTSQQRTADFLTKDDGSSLYTFDTDPLNGSACDEDCQKRWTKLIGTAGISPELTLIKETDQLLYRKHALYTFNNDETEGDIKGDNFNKTWHLIYAPNKIGDEQVVHSSKSMKQTYLTDENGRALYTFDRDQKGESNCYAGCENQWPVYHAPILMSVPSPLLKTDFGTIQRDKTKVLSGALEQTTYKGQPLYYYFKDLDKKCATTGDWVGGVWHLIEIDAHKTSKKADKVYPLPKKISDIGLSEEAKKGRDLFYNPKRGSCFKCHGNDGKSQPPSIVGEPINNVISRFGDVETIKERLLDMKNNPDSGRDPSMIKGAKALSLDEIDNVSKFIATLKD